MYTNNRYHNYKNQQNERELINETIAALGWELNPEEEYEFSKLLQGLKDISKKVVYKAKPFAHAGMILAEVRLKKLEGSKSLGKYSPSSTINGSYLRQVLRTISKRC